MIKKAIKYFNTSGPNIPDEHYTVRRTALIEQGLDLVLKKRYFTIWAPRQTGKSTYFRQLAEDLKTNGYKPVYFSVEGFDDYSAADMFDSFCREMRRQSGIDKKIETFKEFEQFINEKEKDKLVLIVDEIEDLNSKIFSQFLHTIRNLYHNRNEHCLHSTVLVGVTNILGIVADNASPFNIADNLEVPYLTSDETTSLLEMHEKDTNQIFDKTTKEKIINITANQPGLVNGFANRLVTTNPEKEVLTIANYLKVEKWYLREVIDKNIENIVSKADKYRKFVERLLFTENKISFDISRKEIKFLYTQGVIRKDEDDNVDIWVPVYKKKLFAVFYPYSNGESKLFFRNTDADDLLDKEDNLDFDEIINNYKSYVKKRGFSYFREKDKESGEYLSLKESALAYSFETYIQTLVVMLDGKSYLEPHIGLGRSDLIINIENKEYVIEFKIFRDSVRFKKGKNQVAYYASSLGLNEAVYLVFVPNSVTVEKVKEEKEVYGGVLIKTYIVRYDEQKDF